MLPFDVSRIPGFVQYHTFCEYLTHQPLVIHTLSQGYKKQQEEDFFFFACIGNDVLGHSRVTENLVWNILSLLAGDYLTVIILLVELL